MYHPSRLRSRLPATAAVAAVTAALLGLPAVARASTTTSANWSGYAVHRAGTSFREASATWREPSGSCSALERTYSSFWVGLGGYAGSSDALEQIGSELDCTAAGALRASVWYELVPAASRSIAMTVHVGDVMSAAVSITGHRVHLRIADLTRHERFARTVIDSDLDLSSAEWIAEAPSDCAASDCTVLALTDFGSASFLRARAQTSTGATGTITSALWRTTRITLRATDASHETDASQGATEVTATPSSATPTTGAFSVAYATRTASAGTGNPPTTGPGGGGPPSASARRADRR